MLFKRKKSFSASSPAPNAKGVDAKRVRHYFLKPHHRIAFYVVVRVADKEALTFVSSVAQAQEYIDIMVANQYNAHYIQWCPLHGFDPLAPDSWNAYCSANRDVLKAYGNYTVEPVYYSLDQISTIIRSVTGRLPVGASYEDEYEQAYFKNMNKRNKELEAAKGLVSPQDAIPLSQDDYETDPVYRGIIDDTIKYLEDRFIQAGYLPADLNDIPPEEAAIEKDIADSLKKSKGTKSSKKKTSSKDNKKYDA